MGYGLDRLLQISPLGGGHEGGGDEGLDESYGAKSRWEGEDATSPLPPPFSPPKPGAEGEEPVTRVWGESLKRLCADPLVAPHARLEPRLAVPYAYQVCMDGCMDGWMDGRMCACVEWGGVKGMKGDAHQYVSKCRWVVLIVSDLLNRKCWTCS